MPDAIIENRIIHVVMKKILLLVLIFLTGMICNAQLRPPVQTDTLMVTSVRYNASEIRKENWPCSVIYKSTTMFTIGDQRFKILDATNLGIVLFSVTDVDARDSSDKYTLTYVEVGDDVMIRFSGYLFMCKKYPLDRKPADPEPADDTGQEIFADEGGAHDYQDDYGEYAMENGLEEYMEEDGSIPFQLVEEKPSFNGGDANAFSKWVNERLVYPELAKENGISGRVTLQFTVDTDGTVINVKVLRGVDPALDKEAVRVVSMSPRWTPGSKDGRPVKVTYTFPVIFHLR